MVDTDWKQVAHIYQQGIATGDATFEQHVPEWAIWDKDHLKSCRIIALDHHTIAGWAALSPVSGRCVYGGVAEVSVYVADNYRGQKIGHLLLEQLITVSEKENFWTLQAGIFRENTASLHLHKKLGFREIGYREKIGKMNGRWRDVILLERRSGKVGLK